MFARKIVNIFLPISFNICFGCSKKPSCAQETVSLRWFFWVPTMGMCSLRECAVRSVPLLVTGNNFRFSGVYCWGPLFNHIGMSLGTYAPSLLQGACILCACALAMTLCASVLYWHASALFDWHLLVTPSHLIAHPKICWVFSQHMWVHTTYVWRNNSSSGLPLNIVFKIPWLFTDFSLTFDRFPDRFGRSVLAIFIHRQLENFVQIFMQSDLIFKEKS